MGGTDGSPSDAKCTKKVKQDCKKKTLIHGCEDAVSTISTNLMVTKIQVQ